MIVEVCANSLESAINAEKAGASRIELCSELAVGGITPSYGLLKMVSEEISIPVRVLIRPRSGDFSYSDAEFEIMKRDIELCAEIGFEGVVLGLLLPDFSLDESRLSVLRAIDPRLNMTFHRAFDWVSKPEEAMPIIENLGFDTILSSGQENKAINGVNLLSKLHQTAKQLTIMPGSGVNLETIQSFKEIGFHAIHLSAVQMNQKLAQRPKVPMNSASMLSDDAVPISNLEVIRQIVETVKI